jgi:hypothetical protein
MYDLHVSRNFLGKKQNKTKLPLLICRTGKICKRKAVSVNSAGKPSPSIIPKFDATCPSLEFDSLVKYKYKYIVFSGNSFGS